MGQSLAPKLCPQCKKKYTAHKKEVQPIFNGLIEQFCRPEQVYLKNASGCEQCNGKGVKGRTGIFEVIEIDAQFMHLYHTCGKTSAYNYWYENGGSTLCENTLRLINQGIIDPVSSHKNICNLDRDCLVFTDVVRETAKRHREGRHE